MSNRITEKMLQARIDYLNKITNSPMESYSKDEQGRYRANIGNFHLSHAYGGVCIHRMTNTGGGVICPLGRYHAPKREAYEALNAFIAGIEFEQNKEGK